MCPLFLVLSAAVAASAAPLDLAVEAYEHGELESAGRMLTRLVSDPSLDPPQRARARVFLAATLHAQGKAPEAAIQLAILGRDHPDFSLDAALFPPDFLAFAATALAEGRRSAAQSRPPAVQPDPARAPPVVERGVPPPPARTPVPAEAGNPLRPLGFIAASGGGAVVLGAGALFGWTKLRESALTNGDPSIGSLTEARRTAQELRTLQSVSLAIGGVGVAAAGIGIFMYLQPGVAAPTAWVSPRSAGVALGGTF